MHYENEYIDIMAEDSDGLEAFCNPFQHVAAADICLSMSTDIVHLVNELDVVCTGIAAKKAVEQIHVLGNVKNSFSARKRDGWG